MIAETILLVRADIQVPVQPGDSVDRSFVPAFYVNAGANITFNARLRDPAIRCQWRLNGRNIEGETDPVLALANVGATAAGTYSVLFSEPGDDTAMDVATLTVVACAGLANISVRSRAGSADEALVVGFYISGAGFKNVLLRGIGPTLREFGVVDALAQPEMALVGWGGKVLASNSGWENRAALAEAFARVGAFAISIDSADAALLESLETGGYCVRVTGADNTAGAALVELYDADTGASSTSFANVSGRAFVKEDSAPLVIGFRITGTTSATIIIRGIGPSLETLFGLSGTLAHAGVILRDSSARQIASNDCWGGGASLAAAFSLAGAFELPPKSCDSALLITLQPGAYTAELSGVNKAAGIGLLEIYKVPSP